MNLTGQADTECNDPAAGSSSPYGNKTGVRSVKKQPLGRGLHSSTFRLSFSIFCGIGFAFSGCLKGVSGCSRGDLRCYLCHQLLRLELRSGRV